jgi:hypothetical protein
MTGKNLFPQQTTSRVQNVIINKGLNERGFQNGVAKMSVDSKSSAHIKSDELSLKDFGTFSVEVVSSTANQLELTVVPK